MEKRRRNYLVHKKKYNDLVKEQNKKLKLYKKVNTNKLEIKKLEKSFEHERRSRFSMFENLKLTKNFKNLNKLTDEQKKLYKKEVNKLANKVERVASKYYDKNHYLNINRVYIGYRDKNGAHRITLGNLFNQLRNATPTDSKEFNIVKYNVEEALKRLNSVKLQESKFINTNPIGIGEIKQPRISKNGSIDKYKNFEVFHFNQKELDNIKNFEYVGLEEVDADIDDGYLFESLPSSKFNFSNVDKISDNVNVIYNESNPSLVESIRINELKMNERDYEAIEDFIKNNDVDYMFEINDYKKVLKKNKNNYLKNIKH